MMTHPLSEPSNRADHTQCAHDQLAYQIKAMRGDAEFLDKLGQTAGANLLRSNANALEDIQNYMRGIQQ